MWTQQLRRMLSKEIRLRASARERTAAIGGIERTLAKAGRDWNALGDLIAQADCDPHDGVVLGRIIKTVALPLLGRVRNQAWALGDRERKRLSELEAAFADPARLDGGELSELLGLQDMVRKRAGLRA
jgi:hypothetical protein